MKIRSVEPTPSPNTMKFTLSESLPQGNANNYKQEDAGNAPDFVHSLLEIDGIKSVYHVSDFIAVDRHPKADWKEILPQVRAVFGQDSETEAAAEGGDHFGEVTIEVQMFKDIPMQVKAADDDGEAREALSARFAEAAGKAALPEDNIVMMRSWEQQKPRYGDRGEAAKEVAEELEAAYSQERLDRLVQKSLHPDSFKAEREWVTVTLDMLDHEDWRQRFAWLEQMDPQMKDLEVLEKALQDEKSSIRRLAAVYISMLEDESVIPVLEKAMLDKSVTVRRTAADGFSDIGSPAGIPAMIRALEDKSRLVRWRAAMFLYELGDDRAAEPLRRASEDPEFEVALQAKIALARIEKGEEAKGSVWKQMADAFDNGNEEGRK
ncbi:conserved virulence factor C family protein [Alkalicoccus luteus]|uniref:Virulence factor n=1 Tax=Alkalicoccus luteus TaxID=1237094 RepID=A0A969PWQ8_9BACI|nr:conserved virulence factor C family protein [Alkalicoccus luteus]NJP38884.1 virulence factor [Alkalicoccus luteus]